MAHLKFKRTNIIGSHAFLLKRLADAIDWLRQAEGDIWLDLPEDVGDAVDGRPVSTTSCIPPPHTPPGLDERVDAEVLLAVLKAMKEKGGKRSKGKSKTK